MMQLHLVFSGHGSPLATQVSDTNDATCEIVSTRHSNLALVAPGTRRKSSARPDLNRREHERLVARELAWLNLVRVKYGPAVSLLDLSAGGAQIEASDLSLRPGASVVIEIAGKDCEFAVPSQIVRCQVSRISPRMVYRGALEA